MNTDAEFILAIRPVIQVVTNTPTRVATTSDAPPTSSAIESNLEAVTNAKVGSSTLLTGTTHGEALADTAASRFTIHFNPKGKTMTSISMYQASVPRFVNILGNLSKILDKAKAHCEAKKIDETALTTFRLYPDMLAMTRQVQIASDTAKGLVARLAGAEIPAWEDNEKTLADLQARIQKTIDFVQAFKPAQIDGTEDKEIIVKRADKETRYTGMQFLLGHAVPNIYFHVSAAYNILRHNGVEIGKRDYLGNP